MNIKRINQSQDTKERRWPSAGRAENIQFSLEGKRQPKTVGPNRSPPKISPMTRGSLILSKRKEKAYAENRRNTRAMKNRVSSRLLRVMLWARVKLSAFEENRCGREFGYHH